MRRTAVLLAAAVLLGACAPKTPSLSEEIRLAVNETLAAIPTHTPPPTPRALPAPTQARLAGIFYEYQFCIGHPDDMPFYDVVAKQNPGAPTASRYDDGILATNNSSLFIELIWQNAPSGTDPQFLLDLILEGRVDTRNGAVERISVKDLGAVYVSILSTATAVLPYGGASAWTCGGRAFAWKAYTTQPDLAKNLVLEALQAFHCDT